MSYHIQRFYNSSWMMIYEGVKWFEMFSFIINFELLLFSPICLVLVNLNRLDGILTH